MSMMVSASWIESFFCCFFSNLARSLAFGSARGKQKTIFFFASSHFIFFFCCRSSSSSLSTTRRFREAPRQMQQRNGRETEEIKEKETSEWTWQHKEREQERKTKTKRLPRLRLPLRRRHRRRCDGTFLCFFFYVQFLPLQIFESPLFVDQRKKNTLHCTCPNWVVRLFWRIASVEIVSRTGLANVNFEISFRKWATSIAKLESKLDFSAVFRYANRNRALIGRRSREKGWRHEPGGDDVIQGWPEDRESQ